MNAWALARAHCSNRARCVAGDLLHGVQDRGVVELAVGVEAEERVDERRWRMRRHLKPRLLVGERLVSQWPAEYVRQRVDLLARPEGHRTAQCVRAALMAGLGEDRRGDGRNIGGVDRRDRDIGPRRAHDITLTKLGKPPQRVRLVAAGTEDRPRYAGVANAPTRSRATSG